MNLSQGLLLKNLILHGHRKDYQVEFQPGINIIYGDVDTGKSSILRLIYYLLGGKKIDLDEEISSSVKYAALELCINGSAYCIIRDIFNSSKDIEVYPCLYSEISSSFPEKYKSSVAKGNETHKSLSDFLLDALELPNVRLKQAPTKDESSSARLSVLDLFKFIYLDQDDVGSAHMLNIGNYVLEAKNREVFKYMFNVLDSGISQFESDISNKTTEKLRLSNQYSAISLFLAETGLKSSEDLDEEIESIDDIKVEVENRLFDVNQRMIGDSDLYNGLNDALNTIRLNIEEQEENKSISLRNIERFGRLLNDYQNDIEKLKSSLSSVTIIGREIENKINCPVCESAVIISDLSEKFDISSNVNLKSELTSITRRSKDLKVLIAENREDLALSTSHLSALYLERNKARQYIDEELSSSISPYLAERDLMVKELAQLDERRDKASHSLRVRKKQAALSNQIMRLEGAIEKLKLDLDELKNDAPSLDDIVKNLSTDINRFIQRVNIKNHFGTGIDEKTLFPKVRNIEYRKINSGGIRTIASIGYLAAILKQKLRKETNIPGLLMIDTVGKFLGKTSDDGVEVQNEITNDTDGVSDPEKYKNLFEALVEVAEEFDNEDKLCQIILVDNDIPHDVAFEIKGFEIAHYRSNGINGLPIGLIDDWDSTLKQQSNNLGQPPINA